jgi:hypothetical protein
LVRQRGEVFERCILNDKARCNNIERKSSRDKMKERKSPSPLCHMKTEGAENCIETDVIWMTELG